MNLAQESEQWREYCDKEKIPYHKTVCVCGHVHYWQCYEPLTCHICFAVLSPMAYNDDEGRETRY